MHISIISSRVSLRFPSIVLLFINNPLHLLVSACGTLCCYTSQWYRSSEQGVFLAEGGEDTLKASCFYNIEVFLPIDFDYSLFNQVIKAPSLSKVYFFPLIICVPVTLCPLAST